MPLPLNYAPFKIAELLDGTPFLSRELLGNVPLMSREGKLNYIFASSFFASLFDPVADDRDTHCKHHSQMSKLIRPQFSKNNLPCVRFYFYNLQAEHASVNS